MVMNTVVQYENLISFGLKVIAKVKAFLQTANADANAREKTFIFFSSPIIHPGSPKIYGILSYTTAYTKPMNQ